MHKAYNCLALRAPIGMQYRGLHRAKHGPVPGLRGLIDSEWRHLALYDVNNSWHSPWLRKLRDPEGAMTFESWLVSSHHW